MPISYTAIVLTQKSHDALMSLVPEGWEASKTCHHCTLTMGRWKDDDDDRKLIGQKVEMSVNGFASDDKVCAVSVTLPSNITAKGPPHITVATTNGGKPFQAGELDFLSAESPEGMPQTLTGIIKEVEERDYSLATDSQVKAESRSISLLRAMISEAIICEEYKPAHGDEPVTGDLRNLSGADLEKFRSRSVANSAQQLADMSGKRPLSYTQKASDAAAQADADKAHDESRRLYAQTNSPRRASYAQRASDAAEQEKSDKANAERQLLYTQSEKASAKYQKDAQIAFDKSKEQHKKDADTNAEEMKKKIIVTLNDVKDDYKSAIPYFKLSELWEKISLPGANKDIGAVLKDLVNSKALKAEEFKELEGMKWDEAVLKMNQIFGLKESAFNHRNVLMERWQKLAGLIK